MLFTWRKSFFCVAWVTACVMLLVMSKTRNLNVVVTKGLLDDIDSLVEDQQKAAPNLGTTRSDVVRGLICDGLSARGYPKSSKPAASRKAK